MTGPPRPAPPEIDHSGYTGPGFELLNRQFEPHLPAAHPDAVVAPPHSTTSPSLSGPSISVPTRSPTVPPTRPMPQQPVPVRQTTVPPDQRHAATPLQETPPPAQHHNAPPDQWPAAPPQAGPRGRGGLVAVVLAVLLVGTGLGVGGVVLFGGGGKPASPQPTPTPTSAAPSARPSAAIPARIMRAAAPRNVRAVGKGPLATLRWSLTKGNNFPILVQQADEIGSAVPQFLPARTLSTTITGLDGSKGYCFVVGALVAMGQSTGHGTVSWSKPACIRGATVQ